MSDHLAQHLNALPPDAAGAVLRQCCGAERWAEHMLAARPFADDQQVFATAERLWWALDHADWREAFAHHPRIGETNAGRRERQEQSGVATATADTRQALAEGNRVYERRFGHVFLICATGRSAEQMLAELRRRLTNAPDEELGIAAAEQAKITRLRLEQLAIP